ncbi:MAG: AMP-binding protein [Gemmatimonadaceae bacterium]|nr:AMP-binding protein [Gemmatimonadaceae bacterium]
MTAPLLHPSAHVDTFAREHLPPAEEWPILHLDGPFAYPPQLNVAERLLDAAIREGHGDRPLLLTPGIDGTWQTTTWAEFSRQVDAWSHVLRDRFAVVPGNRVLLRGFNGRDLAAAWFAVMKVGAIAVTTMPMLREPELRVVLRTARCALAITDVRLADALRAAAAADDAAAIPVTTWGADDPNDVHRLAMGYTAPFPAVATSSDDVCLIAFTSGTTGVPKGCMHFHRDVMAMCDGFSAQVLRPTPDDRCIGTPPLAFTFGLGGLLCFPMAARASTVLLEKATPDSLLDAIAATRATISFTAPTFYRHMALAIQAAPGRFDVSSLRQSVSAGEALPDATRTLWRDASGIEMLDGIGATELIHIFIAAAGTDVRPRAIGRAVPGYEVAILDDALQPVPPGTVGRLAVRGPTGCRYLADPRQRAYVQGGWNLTGDAATMDADGYVYFKARTDDLIISAGYNIGAPEVEAALLTHAAVAECAVIGVPDPERGQAVKAFVVLRPEASPSDALGKALQDHVKATIAPYKYPRQIEFVPALPKTDTGKLQRFRLKEPR